MLQPGAPLAELDPTDLRAVHGGVRMVTAEVSLRVP
jgi:hypothetical protein